LCLKQRTEEMTLLLGCAFFVGFVAS